MAGTGGYYFPAHFYVNVLPELLLGATRLHVLLASKDGVGDFADGPLDTGLDGLTVTIQTDSLRYPRGQLLMQGRLCKRVLAVIFADLDDLDEALELAGRVRADLPDSSAILITDEYALFAAPDKLRQVMDRAAVDGLVVTGLAGKIPMRKTLEHIVKEWPRR